MSKLHEIAHPVQHCPAVYTKVEHRILDLCVKQVVVRRMIQKVMSKRIEYATARAAAQKSMLPPKYGTCFWLSNNIQDCHHAYVIGILMVLGMRVCICSLEIFLTMSSDQPADMVAR